MATIEYAALLRGISPLNPNMRNQKLRDVFKDLGFDDVQTVISSGNVLFRTPRKDIQVLEQEIEAALKAQLGFTTTVIIRSHTELQQLADKQPFKGMSYSKETSLNVTFLQQEPQTKIDLPHEADDASYKILQIHGRDICSVLNLHKPRATRLMVLLEKQFGTCITTRSWQTVEKILKKWA